MQLLMAENSCNSFSSCNFCWFWMSFCSFKIWFCFSSIMSWSCWILLESWCITHFWCLSSISNFKMVASFIWNSCSNCSRVVAISRILVCWYWSLSSSFDLIFLSSSHFPLMCLNSFLRVSCSNAPNLTENFVQVQKVAKKFYSWVLQCCQLSEYISLFFASQILREINLDLQKEKITTQIIENFW